MWNRAAALGEAIENYDPVAPETNKSCCRVCTVPVKGPVRRIAGQQSRDSWRTQTLMFYSVQSRYFDGNYPANK